jgi:hypothetical protein
VNRELNAPCSNLFSEGNCDGIHLSRCLIANKAINIVNNINTLNNSDMTAGKSDVFPKGSIFSFSFLAFPLVPLSNLSMINFLEFHSLSVYDFSFIQNFHFFGPGSSFSFRTVILSLDRFTFMCLIDLFAALLFIKRRMIHWEISERSMQLQTFKK